MNFNNCFAISNDRNFKNIDSTALKIKNKSGNVINFKNKAISCNNFKKEVIYNVFDVWTNFKNRQIDVETVLAINKSKSLVCNFLYCLQFNPYYVEKILSLTCYIIANESKHNANLNKFAKYGFMLASCLDYKIEMSLNRLNNLNMFKHVVFIYLKNTNIQIKM